MSGRADIRIGVSGWTYRPWRGNFYPEGLKQAFNIEELNSVEAYLDAEMLSLIIPLAVAFLAVRVALHLLVFCSLYWMGAADAGSAAAAGAAGVAAAKGDAGGPAAAGAAAGGGGGWEEDGFSA